ncbi:hypothetical protein B0H11DRAFT_1909285 [Mycena galericulata]|nr:hypothetical protein B0H11DRAFT_1909285 [Mycena galericulata]
MPPLFPPPTDMLSNMLGMMRDMEPVSAQSIAQSFGLLDGKWKDFVMDKCSFGERMIGGMNHGKFCEKTFGKNPALEPITNEFAALHLPILIEAYTSAYETRKPLADNWMDSWERYYAYVLRDCVQTMFFSRWMRHHSPESNNLMNKLAGQIAQFPLEVYPGLNSWALQWPEVCEAQRQLERLGIFVWVALRTRQCSPKHAVHIPLETRQKVIPYLKNLKVLVNSELRNPKWRKGRPYLAKDNLTEALRHIKVSLEQYFDGEQRFGGTRDVTMLAEHQQRWDVCAAKSSNCTISDKHRLRECAKTFSVPHSSLLLASSAEKNLILWEEHQRQHWKEHKPTCFTPSY